MSQEMVDAEVVEHKFVGQNFVIVRLPDGMECKITVDVVATRVKDQKLPDGSAIYTLNATPLYSWKPPQGRIVKVPKPQIPTQAKPLVKDNRIIG